MMLTKKTSLIILGVTALVCSGVLLHSFNDPEGPNLLIIVVMALILYVVSLTAYLLKSLSVLKQLLLAIAVQIVVAVGLYFLLR